MRAGIKFVHNKRKFYNGGETNFNPDFTRTPI